MKFFYLEISLILLVFLYLFLFFTRSKCFSCDAESDKKHPEKCFTCETEENENEDRNRFLQR